MLRNSAIFGQHFAFAHGRSGVLQQSLLTRSDTDRLLGAHDHGEVQSILLELPFTKVLEQTDRTAERVVDSLAAWVRREVTAMVPERKRAVFDILWLEGDAPLVAALLKERNGLTTAAHCRPVPLMTAVSSDAWARAIMDGAIFAVPAAFTAFVHTAITARLDDPVAIDAYVARYMTHHMLELAQQSGSRLVQRFVRHGIDSDNIRTALRLERSEHAEADLLQGGTMDPRAFAGARSVAALVRVHGFYALADLLDQPNHTGSDIERMLSDIRAEDIGALWNEPLKLEPVFAFAATALTQLALLRALLIGKRAQLSPQEIKRLLPPFLTASHYCA